MKKRKAIVAFAVIIPIIVFSTFCGCGDESLLTVSVGSLLDSPSDYVGERVEVVGIVHRVITHRAGFSRVL